MREKGAHNEALKAFEAVRHASFLAGYALAPYARRTVGDASGAQPAWRYAAGNDKPIIFERIADHALSELLDRTVQLATPQVIRTPAGLYFFAVPLMGGAVPWCLAGGGVRDASLDLLRVEGLASATREDPIALLETLEQLPIVTFGAVAELSSRVTALVRLLRGHDSSVALSGKSFERLRMVRELSAELDRAATSQETVLFLCESLGIIFDLPGIVTLMPTETGDWRLHPVWGFEAPPMILTAERSRRFTARDESIKLAPHELAELMPVAAGSWGCLIPLATAGRRFGSLLLIGERQSDEDLLQQELLVGRGALRLAALERQQEIECRSARAEQMVSIFSELADIDGMSELCRVFLARAAELVGATSGSLMLLDRAGEFLSIAAVRGMHPTLAQSLTVRVGNGIAGQVAKSGQPLLVNDIGSDDRITIGRRPRFKTGSFVCLPLVSHGETLGVLNLADRMNRTPFGHDELDILATLTTHAAALIRRARTHEGAMHLERLSITDPLTELYNRRFLERRMEEEMSRSIRHGLELSVMILDLDTFKAYNDLCGHQAGDRALKQVAQVLCRSVREMDIVTRYGGEEFCILLPDTPKVDAMFVAERIRYGIEHEFFNGEEGLPLGSLTISIGIATYPENGASSSELVSSADMALYQAKADGRNRIVASHDLPVNTSHFRIVSRSATQQTH